MTAEVRLAEPSDVRSIAELMLDAGAGLYEQLLEGVVPGLATADLLALAIAEEASPYHYGNALVAGDAHGILLGFPAEEFGLPDAAFTVIPDERLDPVRPMFETKVDGSFYVNSLAVGREFARRGIASLLLETSAQLAAMRGFPTISLHVWTDNLPAMRLYQAFGFATVVTIAMAPTPHFRYRGPVALVSAATDRILARLEDRG